MSSDSSGARLNSAETPNWEGASGHPLVMGHTRAPSVFYLTRWAAESTIVSRETIWSSSMPIRLTARNVAPSVTRARRAVSPAAARPKFAAVLAACIGFIGVPGAAWAQSSVQLYGELDAGLAYVSNVGGHSQYRLTTGTIDGSYWGLQGSEDLGGGARAIFRLERGYAVSTGQGLNDHPMYVGLGTDALGTLTFGRQYDSIHDYFAPFTLTGGTGGTAFAHVLDNDNANNSFLAANSVKYTSATYGGFSFGGLYAFSNAAGGFANNRAYSIGANYTLESFSAGAAYLHNDGRGNTTGGAYDARAARQWAGRGHRGQRAAAEHLRRRDELWHRRLPACRRILPLDQFRRERRGYRRRAAVARAQ